MLALFPSPLSNFDGWSLGMRLLNAVCTCCMNFTYCPLPPRPPLPPLPLLSLQPLSGTSLSPPKPSQPNPDYVQCPHCERRFEQYSAERHIPFCKEKHSRIERKAQGNKAMEKLNKRTQVYVYVVVSVSLNT